jgi:hypothetical protein
MIFFAHILTSKVIILYNPVTCKTFYRASLFIMVQGRDRCYVKSVAELLGFDGSYVSHTYIEQIQVEKLMNEVMVYTLLIP